MKWGIGGLHEAVDGDNNCMSRGVRGGGGLHGVVDGGSHCKGQGAGFRGEEQG